MIEEHHASDRQRTAGRTRRQPVAPLGVEERDASDILVAGFRSSRELSVWHDAWEETQELAQAYDVIAEDAGLVALLPAKAAGSPRATTRGGRKYGFQLANDRLDAFISKPSGATGGEHRLETRSPCGGPDGRITGGPTGRATGACCNTICPRRMRA